MLEQELNEFGRRMGLPGLSFSPSGLAALDVERMGRLHLEKSGSRARKSFWCIWPGPARPMTGKRRNALWRCAITGIPGPFP